MVITRKRAANSGSSSTFTLQILTSVTSSANPSITGISILQGPHQGAQKSTNTGISDWITSASKLSFVKCNAAIFLPRFLAIFFGFSECVKAGAKVVNLSLGTSSSRTDDSDNFIDNTFTPAAVSLMMASLISKGYDFIAVQSAGNGDFYGDPIDARHNGHFCSVNESNVYTGLYNVSKSEILDRIIVVTAAENLGNEMYMQPDYSNIGPNVDIAAPGESIYSCSVNSFYTYLSGTSMAAPVVTGVASLVWSVNPSLTGPQVKDIVCSSTDSIARYNDRAGYYDTELTDYPMVNARLAVEEALLRTNNNWGRVTGSVINASVISYNGNEYTVDGNGEFSFVAPEGSGRAIVYDYNGDEVGYMDIIVTAGETTENSELIDIPEVVPDESTTALYEPTTVPETTRAVATTLVAETVTVADN